MRRLIRLGLTVCLLAGGAASIISAQEIPHVPELTVGHLPEGDSPVIDGRVDEASWSSAEPFSGFVQQEPDEGQPATERTEVRFILNRETLYIGIVNFDSEPDRIVVSRAAATPSSPRPTRFRFSSTRSTMGRTRSSSGPIHSVSSTTGR